MYLVSLYFDEETERILQKLIRRTAEKTGNFYMLEHEIPPHLTIAACKTKRERELNEALTGRRSEVLSPVYCFFCRF